jgi:hypothetical protein
MMARMQPINSKSGYSKPPQFWCVIRWLDGQAGFLALVNW